MPGLCVRPLCWPQHHCVELHPQSLDGNPAAEDLAASRSAAAGGRERTQQLCHEVPSDCRGPSHGPAAEQVAGLGPGARQDLTRAREKSRLWLTWLRRPGGVVTADGRLGAFSP